MSPDLQEGSQGTRSPLAEEGEGEEQACSLGGLRILLHVHTHTHPIAHGGVMVLSALGLDRVCLQEFRFKFPCTGSDSHYSSISSQRSHVSGSAV